MTASVLVGVWFTRFDASNGGFSEGAGGVVGGVGVVIDSNVPSYGIHHSFLFITQSTLYYKSERYVVTGMYCQPLFTLTSSACSSMR